MIALKIKDELSNQLEVSLEDDFLDDNKKSIQFKLSTDNYEDDIFRSSFFYINNKEEINALISKLVSVKKYLR